MDKLKVISFLVVITVSLSCNNNDKVDEKKAIKLIVDTMVKSKTKLTPNVVAQKDTFKYFDLAYGFKVKVNARFKYPQTDYDTYEGIELYHNGQKIFRDTIEQYIIFQKPYPILNQIKPGVYEFLLNYFNGPNKDLATFLRIEDDKIARKEKLPSFDKKPKLIYGFLTYNTIWNYGEVWGENGKTYTTCEPEIYYKFATDGLQIDTTLTILKNKQKYGRFEGFTYKGIIGYPSDDRGNIVDTNAKHVLRRAEGY